MSDKKVDSPSTMITLSPIQIAIGGSRSQNSKGEIRFTASVNKKSVAEMEEIVCKLINHIKEN